jgi:hypothetical protein
LHVTVTLTPDDFVLLQRVTARNNTNRRYWALENSPAKLVGEGNRIRFVGVSPPEYIYTLRPLRPITVKSLHALAVPVRASRAILLLISHHQRNRIKAPRVSRNSKPPAPRRGDDFANNSQGRVQGALCKARARTARFVLESRPLVSLIRPPPGPRKEP